MPVAMGDERGNNACPHRVEGGCNRRTVCWCVGWEPQQQLPRMHASMYVLGRGICGIVALVWGAIAEPSVSEAIYMINMLYASDMVMRG